MQKVFGDDEDEIGKRDGQRRFGQPIVAGPGDELQQRPPGQEPQTAPPKKETRNATSPTSDIGLLPGDDHAKQHGEHHDRRGVIQKRLALDEAG